MPRRSHGRTRPVLAEANKNGFEVAFLDRFPPYNGGLQALPWAPPWIGFPLTTVVSRCFPGRLPGPASPLQRWPPGASLGASLGRFPPYNGGIQAPPWAPPWVGFPLTTVASRRLPGRLPGFPGLPWASLGCRDTHSGTPSFLNRFNSQTAILRPAIQGGCRM